MKIFPKKSLGQNFLTSVGAVEKIIETADLSAEDVVLEIGPGKGILTERLSEKSKKVVAVEKDNDLAKDLKEKFKGKNVEVINQDILEFDPPKENYKLVANIPYYITGEILRKFLSSQNQPELAVLLVQKEVAERIVSEKGSLLSISVKVYGEPKLIQKVKAGSFFPKPKVDSAILKIENLSKSFFQNFSEEKFFETLKNGFKHKRKKLSSNLKNPQALLDCGLDKNIRPEELNISDWKCLVEKL